MGDAKIRKPLMSGHCSVGNEGAHERCQRNGGGQRANPEKMFQPCPCACHYPITADTDLFECEGCGAVLIAVDYWPLDAEDDVRYTHIDLIFNDEWEIVGGTGRALGEECGVSRNTEPKSRERDCSRCGDEFTPEGRERVCPDCRAVEAAEKQAELDALDDLSDLDDEDDFSDLDDL